VNGNGPGQADGVLGKAAQLLFIDAVGFLLIRIADVAPGFFCQYQVVFMGK